MDYDSRIADAQNTSNKAYDTYTNTYGQANNSQTDYRNAINAAQTYGDIYNAARSQYLDTDEINAAKGTYQSARDAVNQVSTTLNKLPESIRQQYGGTGLTEAQRQRAMQDQQSNLANTYNYANTNYSNAAADYQTLLNQAMNEVSNVASGNYQGQQSNIENLGNLWANLLSSANTQYGNFLNTRSLLADQYGARDSNLLAQQQMELERWKEEQANARNSSQLNLQKYLTGQQTEAANAQNALQKQLLEQQQRAEYNTYRSNALAGINNQFNSANNNLWNTFWNPLVTSLGGQDYGTSLLNQANKARGNLLSYDQYVGNV